MTSTCTLVVRFTVQLFMQIEEIKLARAMTYQLSFGVFSCKIPHSYQLSYPLLSSRYMLYLFNKMLNVKCL